MSDTRNLERRERWRHATIEIAMVTTRRPDGRLVSRPIATQTQAEGSDLWFVTNIESHKMDELESIPR